jgi:hypothetical protein
MSLHLENGEAKQFQDSLIGLYDFALLLLAAVHNDDSGFITEHEVELVLEVF